MLTSGGTAKLLRAFSLRAAGAAAFSAVAIFAIAGTPRRTGCQAQSQSAAAPPVYEYDVVSVRPSDPANANKPGNGLSSSPDAFTAKSSPLISLIDYAYAIRNAEQLVGATGWISDERFDLNAKMESSVMDALQKLSREDRALARQQMMQAVLADRFKLAVHRETRELQIYTLVIAKNGLKMKEAKPGDTYPNGFKIPGAASSAGSISFQAGPSGVVLTAQGVPISMLLGTISREVGRLIVDKTGLTGNYDFVFQYTPETYHAPSNLGEGGGAMPLPPDVGTISIFTAVQEQLGLKLESVRAPIEVVVIDHVERPSGNQE
jgi:uncharacterized protein (TIGR03435 family)